VVVALSVPASSSTFPIPISVPAMKVAFDTPFAVSVPSVMLPFVAVASSVLATSSTLPATMTLPSAVALRLLPVSVTSFALTSVFEPRLAFELFPLEFSVPSVTLPLIAVASIVLAMSSTFPVRISPPEPETVPALSVTAEPSRASTMPSVMPPMVVVAPKLLSLSVRSSAVILSPAMRMNFDLAVPDTVSSAMFPALAVAVSVLASSVTSSMPMSVPA